MNIPSITNTSGPSRIIQGDMEEQLIFKTFFDNFEAVEMKLISRAQALAQECHDLLRNDYKERKYRRPPLTLSARLRRDRFGPILVWVRYTIAKRDDKKGGANRYTKEVAGRRNHTYPSYIFASFKDQELITQLVDIETRAAAIRRQTSEWSGVATAFRTIMKHDAVLK